MCILIQATVKKTTLLLICFRRENGIVVNDMYADDMTEYRGLLQNNPMGGKENEWSQDEIKLATR